MSGLSRGMRVLVLASLLLNVALVAALVLLVPRLHDRDGGRHERRPPAFPALFDPRALKQALPEARHPALDSALQSHREAIRGRLGALFEARRAVRSAIVAEPFDRAALDAAFVQLRDAETATAAEAQAMLGDVLADSTVAERERVANLMPRRGEHRRGGDRQDNARRDGERRHTDRGERTSSDDTAPDAAPSAD